jgi:alpha-N-acetylglucosamine transferase
MNTAKKGKINKRQFIHIAGLGILFVALVLTFLLLNSNRLDRQENSGGACVDDTNQIITRATAALELSNVNRQADIIKISDEAMQLENYQQDAYCMQLLVIRYVEQGDYEKAKQSLALLTNLIDANNAKTLGFEANFTPVNDLVNATESLGRLNEQIRKNNPYMGGATNE